MISLYRSLSGTQLSVWGLCWSQPSYILHLPSQRCLVFLFSERAYFIAIMYHLYKSCNILAHKRELLGNDMELNSYSSETNLSEECSQEPLPWPGHQTPMLLCCGCTSWWQTRPAPPWRYRCSWLYFQHSCPKMGKYGRVLHNHGLFRVKCTTHLLSNVSTITSYIDSSYFQS